MRQESNLSMARALVTDPAGAVAKPALTFIAWATLKSAQGHPIRQHRVRILQRQIADRAARDAAFAQRRGSRRLSWGFPA
jgi:hypothetical protein